MIDTSRGNHCLQYSQQVGLDEGAQAITLGFREVNQELMEMPVEIISSLDDRNINRSTAQFRLPLGLEGSVAHSYTPDFNYITSIEALFLAWEKFKKGKRLRADVQLYERHLEANLFDLHERLARGRHWHDPYVPFKVFDPKERQIHKATVRDRIVHQAVVNALEPVFEPRFIYDSFSCRKGKGTHAAVKRLHTFLRRASSNNTKTVYVLKCDVKKFFASVDHAVLLRLLARCVKDERTVALLREILNSFENTAGKGIPLGNLTSQLFANVYLHELDWFIKHGLRERHYIRYCDDFVILDQNRQHLEGVVPCINEFLASKLKLTLHPDKIHIRSWQAGIDFLGYVLKPKATLLRTNTKRRMLKRVNINNLDSYLGLCSHADTHQLQQLVRTLAWDTPED